MKENKEMELSKQQQEVKSWFDKTYAQRGQLYLRPPQAYEIFLSLLHPVGGGRLLDVACGLGRLLEVAQSCPVELHGVDLSETAIEQAKERLPNAHFQNGNAEHLPYPDDHFDYLTCIGSLERFLDLEKALQEQHRVGKKSATYCFMVRNATTLGWKLLKEGMGLKNKKGHQGAKSLESWTELFERLDFKVEQVHSDQWPRQRLQRFLNPKMDFKKAKTTLLPLKYANEFIFVLKKK